MNNMYNEKISRGFIATTAVILLATGTLAFSLAALGSVVLYADSVSRREMRIQADLNAEACLDTAALMAAKDYFLSGSVYVSKFNCDAVVSRDGAGVVSIKASASFNGVNSSVSNTTFNL